MSKRLSRTQRKIQFKQRLNDYNEKIHNISNTVKDAGLKTAENIANYRNKLKEKAEQIKNIKEKSVMTGKNIARVVHPRPKVQLFKKDTVTKDEQIASFESEYEAFIAKLKAQQEEAKNTVEEVKEEIKETVDDVVKVVNVNAEQGINIIEDVHEIVETVAPVVEPVVEAIVEPVVKKVKKKKSKKKKNVSEEPVAETISE